MPEHNYPELPDPPPPDDKKPEPAPQRDPWDYIDKPASAILEFRLAAHRAVMAHLEEIERLRFLCIGWNETAAERCERELDNDDIAFLLADRFWLLKRLEEYGKQLKRYWKSLERKNKKKPVDDGDSAPTT